MFCQKITLFFVKNVILRFFVNKFNITHSEAHFVKKVRHEALPQVKTPWRAVGHVAYLMGAAGSGLLPGPLERGLVVDEYLLLFVRLKLSLTANEVEWHHTGCGVCSELL